MAMEHREIKKRFFYKGNEIARFYARYPYIEECPSLSELYALLASNAMSFFEGERYDLLCQKYDSERSCFDRLSSKPERYTALFDARRDNERLKVSCSVTLARGEVEDMIFYEEHSWDTDGEIIIKNKIEKPERNRKSSARESKNS